MCLLREGPTFRHGILPGHCMSTVADVYRGDVAGAAITSWSRVRHDTWHYYGGGGGGEWVRRKTTRWNGICEGDGTGDLLANVGIISETFGEI